MSDTTNTNDNSVREVVAVFHEAETLEAAANELYEVGPTLGEEIHFSKLQCGYFRELAASLHFRLNHVLDLAKRASGRLRYGAEVDAPDRT